MSNKIIYLEVPEDWKDVYYKLLYCLSKEGKDIIDNCTKLTASRKIVFNCWDLFQSAVAAFKLGETKKAELFIDYIKKQLKLTYNLDLIIEDEASSPASPDNPTNPDTPEVKTDIIYYGYQISAADYANATQQELIENYLKGYVTGSATPGDRFLNQATDVIWIAYPIDKTVEVETKQGNYTYVVDNTWYDDEEDHPNFTYNGVEYKFRYTYLAGDTEISKITVQ